jgi:hypothetical protein
MGALTEAQREAVAILVREVRASFASGEIPEAEVSCWSDLHDHVDANDFLQDIEHLNPHELTEPCVQAQMDAFIGWDNEVIDAAEFTLFGKVS